MKINVFIERENKEEIIDVKSVPEIFSKLKINPQTVLIVKNDELIMEDDELKNNDKIKLLSVISGG